MHRLGRQTQTRERLVRTAAELFWNQGYAQTGVNQIIQEANATSGSFYHFFKSKQELAMAVIDDIMGALNKHGIDEQTQKDVLAIAWSLKGEILHV